VLDKDFYVHLGILVDKWESRGVPVRRMLQSPADRLTIYKVAHLNSAGVRDSEIASGKLNAAPRG
jgi:hypothetical protein